MDDGAVVHEGVTTPVPAFEAGTVISEAVVDTTVETDVPSPIAGVPKISAVVPAPIARCPKEAYFRRLHPRPGHPVIGAVIPGPVTR
jgi:hypothetical protein